jgi:hypothetical protein
MTVAVLLLDKAALHVGAIYGSLTIGMDDQQLRSLTELLLDEASAPPERIPCPQTLPIRPWRA